MFGVEEKKRENNKKQKQPFFKIPYSTKRFHKALPFVVAFIVISLLIGYYLYLNYYSNYNYIKKDASKYLVFTTSTKKNSDKTLSEIPELNIDSADAVAVNEKVHTFAEKFLAKKGTKLTYETQLNGEVLSLLLKMVDNNTGYAPKVDFYTYNLNLKSLKLMTTQEILALYGLTEDSVEAKIAGQFQSFYNDEVAKGIIVPQECNYDCFLMNREVDNYMDSVHYYIENGKLIAYRPFIAHSIYGEETYFKEEDFQFYIAG